MKEIGYNRQAAVDYAQKWAYGRNPNYLDFEEIGGDCTNFASQCIYAGCGVMNPKKDLGWYYYSSTDRAPAWTSVRFLYNFLTGNKGIGPYASEVDVTQVEIGDIVQFCDEKGEYYHSPVIVALSDDEIYVAAHSYDAYMRPITSYDFASARFLHIQGARTPN